MNKEILMVADAISNEKGIERNIIFQVIESSLAATTQKLLNTDADIRVSIDQSTGDVSTFRRWLVVADDFATKEVTVEDATAQEQKQEATARYATAQEQRQKGTARYATAQEQEDDEATYNPDIHISESEAANKNASLSIGAYYEELIEDESSKFGRISVQMSKQIMMRKIRDAELNQVVLRYAKTEGTLVSGTVKRISRDKSFMIVDLGSSAEAIIYRDQLIGREVFRVNDRIRGIITEVVAESDFSKDDRLNSERQNHYGIPIVISRIVPEMVSRMFELEAPEIAEHIITICKVARDPGLRSKIAVRTNDARIDPVGACVGIRGARVQAVTNELNGERIDIVLWDDDPAQLAINVLAPAEVESIVMDEKKHILEVAADSDNLAQAIGRNGQNVRLATQMTGWAINLISSEEADYKQSQTTEKWIEKFTTVLDIDKSIAEVLIEEGFTEIQEIAHAKVHELEGIESFNQEIAEFLSKRAQEAMLLMVLSGEQATPSDDLLNMKGMDNDLAYKLAQMGVTTMEDLAELSTEEFMEVNDDTLDEERAGILIMTAREPWFN